MFAFKFCNYYSTLFYIAFVKDAFVGYPGNYHYIIKDCNEDGGGFRYESADWLVDWPIGALLEHIFRWQGCDDGGCSSDLAIQLIFVMIGSQFVEESFQSSHWSNTRSIRDELGSWKLIKLIGKGVLNFFGSRFFDRRKDTLIFDDNNQKTQWEKDFKLLAPENWTNGEK